MYWKFKLPLIAILVAILCGIIYAGVNYYRDKSAEQPQTAKELDEAEKTSSGQQEPIQLVRSETTTIQAAKPFQVREITEENKDTKQTADEDAPEKPEEIVAELPQPPKTTEPELKPLAQTHTEPNRQTQMQQRRTTEGNLPPIQQKNDPQTPPVTQPQMTETTVPAPQKKPMAQTPMKPQPPQTQVIRAENQTVAETQASAIPNAKELLETAEKRLQQKKYLQARQIAQKAIATPGVREYDPTWRKAAQIISKVNRIFTFTRTPCPEKTTYTIREGDVLVRIAHRQKTSLLAILAMNPGIKPRTLWVGRKITYIDGDWSIKVSKSNFILTLYRNGELFRTYPVGIGKDGRTPVGTFKIKDKVMNPAWDSPEGRILPNDPRNILGTRWMGLLATGQTNDQLIGYGIHGTTLPETVGTPSSAGCVRLRNPDVEDLYTYIPEPGSATVPVLITD